MTPAEFIASLNNDATRRELFRIDPVSLAEEAELTIGDVLTLANTFDNLRDKAMRDMAGSVRLLEFIAKHGPEMSRSQTAWVTTLEDNACPFPF